jgi:hypothetical protein
MVETAAEKKSSTVVIASVCSKKKTWVVFSLWLDMKLNLGKLSPADKLIQVGPDTISPSVVVRHLGVLVYSELNMKSHISRVTH